MIARLNDGYFMLDVAVERDIHDGRLFNVGQLEARIKGVLLATMTQDESPAFVSCRENHNKRADHVHTARHIFVRLEERVLSFLSYSEMGISKEWQTTDHKH